MTSKGLFEAGMLAVLALGTTIGCGDVADEATRQASGLAAIADQDSTDRVAVMTGLSRPEAVRYDPDADVWYVSNFGPGRDRERDADGFISRARRDGSIDVLRFMTGGPLAPLHMPRGMALRGDTLFVADVDGVHAFERTTGAQLGFVDLTAHQPGFLNDLAFDGAGRLHVTDTGRGRVYRLENGRAILAVEDPRTGPPNGIAWDEQSGAFLLAPWRGETMLRSWNPGTGEFRDVAQLRGANFDGIEIAALGVLIASQADSMLYVLEGDSLRAAIRVAGAPADIGFDPGLGHVAVPYVALDRVDVWVLR